LKDLKSDRKNVAKLWGTDSSQILIIKIDENDSEEILTNINDSTAANSGAVKIMRPSCHHDVLEMSAFVVVGTDYNTDSQLARKANNYVAGNNIVVARKVSDMGVEDKKMTAVHIPTVFHNNSYYSCKQN
jgi:hypothetical protein